MLTRLLVVRPCASLQTYSRQFRGTAQRQYKAEELDADGLPKDYKLKTLKLISRRMDNVVHRCANLSQMETEKAIAKGNVRVNEEIVKKKAHSIEEGDEIEIWITKLETNSDLAHSRRMIVHSLQIDPKDGYVFTIKYWRDMIIQNWKNSSL